MLALIDAFERNPNAALPQEYTDMSPHAVNSFVNDLVAMAKAMEQVPELEEDVRALSKECDQKTNHIRELETHIIGYKDTITALQCTVRNLEAARDDAEYRFLETEDRYAKVADLVKAASLALGVAEPVLPQPEPQTVVFTDPPAQWEADQTSSWATGQSESLPIPERATISTQPVTDTSKDTSEDGLASQSGPQGQSEADPIPRSSGHTEVGSSGQVETGSTQIAPSDPDPEPIKYAADGFITQAWWDWSDRNLYGSQAAG